MRFARHFVFAGIIALVPVLFFEGLARVLPGIQPAWLRQRQEVAKFALERNGTHIFAPGLGYVLKPDMERELRAHQDFDFTYRTARLGTENIGVRDRSGDGKVWAFAVGDSFIEGYGVEAEDLWMERLERDLGRNILNLGQSGFTTHQYAEIFRRAAAFHHPEVAFVCIFENDFEERLAVRSLADYAEQEGMWEIRSPLKKFNFWLLAHSASYRVLRAPDILIKEVRKKRAEDSQRDFSVEVVKVREPNLNLTLQVKVSKKTGEAIRYDTASADWSEIVSLMDQDIGAMRDQAKAMGTRLLLLYLPSKEQSYRSLLARKFKVSPDFDASGHAVEAMARRHGISFLDLTETFRKEAEMGKQLYWPVDGHWNPEGQSLAGREIAAWIKREKIIR